jgi:hypothetical protein
MNSPRVVSETIDGEAVVINLDTGQYFSLEGTAAFLWEFLTQHGSVACAAERLADAFEGVPAGAADLIERFAGELAGHGLIVPEDAGGPSIPEAREADAGTKPNGIRPKFQPPVLLKFDDMEELLQLDPIHEVDESGWPRTN